MFPKPTGPTTDTGKDDAPPLPQCNVFISTDGSVAVDGQRIEVAGSSAQTAALDHLHQLAMAMEMPVEASVLDQQRRSALLIRVRPDGASELIDAPLSLDDPEAPVQAPPAQTPVPQTPPAQTPVPQAPPPRPPLAPAAPAQGPQPHMPPGMTPSAGVRSPYDRPAEADRASDPAPSATNPYLSPPKRDYTDTDTDTAMLTPVTSATGLNLHDGGTGEHRHGAEQWSAPVTAPKVSVGQSRPGPSASKAPDPTPRAPALHDTRMRAQEPAQTPMPAREPAHAPASPSHSPRPSSLAAPSGEPRRAVPRGRPEAESQEPHHTTTLRRADLPSARMHEAVAQQVAPTAPELVHAPGSPPAGPQAPVAVPIPPSLAEGVALVCEAVTTGDLGLARNRASTLERQAAREFGPEHLYAVETCALSAYVAHLSGDHSAATALSLRAAELRYRQGDQRAQEDIERAAATWELLNSPAPPYRSAGSCCTCGT